MLSLIRRFRVYFLTILAAGGISLTPDAGLVAQSVTPFVIVVCEGQTDGGGAFLSQGSFSRFFSCGGSSGSRVGIYAATGISDPNDFPINVQLFIGDPDDFPNLKSVKFAVISTNGGSVVGYEDPDEKVGIRVVVAIGNPDI